MSKMMDFLENTCTAMPMQNDAPLSIAELVKTISEFWHKLRTVYYISSPHCPQKDDNDNILFFALDRGGERVATMHPDNVPIFVDAVSDMGFVAIDLFTDQDAQRELQDNWFRQTMIEFNKSRFEW